MKLTIADIPFTAEAVPGATRLAVLSEPTILQALLRPVYAWDHAAQSGTVTAREAPEGGIPLPNGVVFFVPRLLPDGRLGKAEGPSRRMAERFLAAVGATSVTELLGALTRLLHLPRKSLPLAEFAPLNRHVSYRILMETEFAVVRIAQASRNLSAHLLIPAQVGFTALPATEADRPAWEAMVAADPALGTIRPGFVVPSRTRANADLRRLALARRLEELGAEVAAAGGEAKASPLQKATAARLAAEWRVIAPPQPARPNGAATA